LTFTVRKDVQTVGTHSSPVKRGTLQGFTNGQLLIF